MRPSLPEQQRFEGIPSTLLQSSKECDRVHDVARVTAFDYADVRSGYAAPNFKASGINGLVRVLKAAALASFQGLFRHLRGETAAILRQGSPSAETRLEPGTSR